MCNDTYLHYFLRPLIFTCTLKTLDAESAADADVSSQKSMLTNMIQSNTHRVILILPYWTSHVGVSYVPLPDNLCSISVTDSYTYHNSI